MSIKDNIKNNLSVWDNNNTWVNDGEEWSKHFGNTDMLWDEHIYPKIKDHLNGNVLEIAPGRGRITRKLLEYPINLKVIDLSPTCINVCIGKFGDNIENYYIGNGKDLRDIDDSSTNFVFSFDSFVHMHKDVINSYLGEINRILKKGGHCFIHHSNLVNGNDNNFQNVAGRSNMTINEFASLANKNNLNVVEQKLIKWDAEGNPDWLHDCLSLVVK